MDLARRFARSLDDEEYFSAARCLASTCEYQIAGKVHIGSDAIITLYRKSADWAARTLDGIRYESNVRAGDAGAVIVEFVDYLEHCGRNHMHRCEQHLTFDERGLISKIKHVELPGEKDAVERFFSLVGLSSDKRQGEE